MNKPESIRRAAAHPAVPEKGLTLASHLMQRGQTQLSPKELATCPDCRLRLNRFCKTVACHGTTDW